jgi:hypothetical protein
VRKVRQHAAHVLGDIRVVQVNRTSKMPANELAEQLSQRVLWRNPHRPVST